MDVDIHYVDFHGYPFVLNHDLQYWDDYTMLIIYSDGIRNIAGANYQSIYSPLCKVMQ